MSHDLTPTRLSRGVAEMVRWELRAMLREMDGVRTWNVVTVPHLFRPTAEDRRKARRVREQLRAVMTDGLISELDRVLMQHDTRYIEGHREGLRRRGLTAPRPPHHPPRNTNR